MKFQFKIQSYQTDAVNSVVDVFAGQSYQSGLKYTRDLGIRERNKTMSVEAMPLDFSSKATVEEEEIDDMTGFENVAVAISDEQLLTNIRSIQLGNNIKQASELVQDIGRCSLDVEMETGTGKTYVYIKTIFEMNKKYGWSKFIIVVPSVAIREGVKKSFEITEEHFMEHYKKKTRFFVYNSKNFTDLDSFSSSANINVMIINIQAFNRTMKEGAKNAEALRIYSEQDSFGSRRPIDVIKANRPILILDEPQKMGGAATQKSLQNFNPLFCLNYSATHVKHHNLVYVLDAVDAYNKRLVKKIEVKGFEVKNLKGTNQYLFLENIIISPKKPPLAKIELEIKHQGGIKKELRTLAVDDDLYVISNNSEQYQGYHISEIDPIHGTVTFTNGKSISRGEVLGDISEKDMRRIQIRETIISHLEKERKNFDLGIKTLSLFFIDEVAKYRAYDENNEPIMTEYAQIFENEYQSAFGEYMSTQKDSPYSRYLKGIDGHLTHEGYFSIDKHNRAINSTVKRGSDESDDVSAYDLILKDKERLLSFEEPIRFIFSHSALREGWDNPNVFQICTLRHSDSNTKKRQEVGRGLRLAVNQTGNRMDLQLCGATVHDINVLTVIANESYTDFVTDLQKRIKEDLYERPAKASMEYFEGKTVIDSNEQKIVLDAKQARVIYQYLVKNSYIDENEAITGEYHDDVENNTLAPLPDSLKNISDGVQCLIQSVFDENILKNMVSDGNTTKITENELNDNFYKKEFQTLWHYINHQYAYKVQFESAELIHKAVAHMNEKMQVASLQYTVTSASQRKDLDQESIAQGQSFEDKKTRTKDLKAAGIGQVKYDLIGKIAEGTTLTRRTVAEILYGITAEKFALFQDNPEEFISKSIKLINEQKATMIVEHITYNSTDMEYDSTIFTAEKHSGDIAKAFQGKKHIQDYVFTDGIAEKSIERRFAEDLDGAEEVCVYAKLPKGFAIPTPVGRYSPDWAIAFYEGTVKHIYFIAETKGTMESLQLRPIEKAKIDCAKKLFNEISTSEVRYHDVDSYQSLLNIMGQLK